MTRLLVGINKQTWYIYILQNFAYIWTFILKDNLIISYTVNGYIPICFM